MAVDLLSVFWRELCTVLKDSSLTGIHEAEDYELLLLRVDSELKFDIFLCNLMKQIAKDCFYKVALVLARHLNWVHIGKGVDFDLVTHMTYTLFIYYSRLFNIDPKDFGIDSDSEETSG